jgi:hypothetical protein
MAQPNSGIGNVTTNRGLVEMAMAYSRSRVLCAAAHLGLAEALGDDVRSVSCLAEECQADANALYRLLRALASIGVTEETTPEHFQLTSFGKPLRRGVHLRGMLVDLESSVDAAKTRFAEEDPSSRCELIAADLTQSVPAGADVYMLKHVLHGRQDGDAVTVLRNCRAVIPQNGSLLIVEFILPPLVSHADPQLEGHLMSDLNMLAVTGGRERSEREWRTLLEAAGFILTGVYPVGGDNLMVRNVGILEAKPA